MTGGEKKALAQAENGREEECVGGGRALFLEDEMVDDIYNDENKTNAQRLAKKNRATGGFGAGAFDIVDEEDDVDDQTGAKK